MTPNVIRARIKRLEARKPSINFWGNRNPDKYKEMALRNIKIIEDEIEKLRDLIDDQENRNTQGEITKQD
jgi:hypothetical protein